MAFGFYIGKFCLQRKLRSVQKSVEPNATNALPTPQLSVDEKPPELSEAEEPTRRDSQPNEVNNAEITVASVAADTVTTPPEPELEKSPPSISNDISQDTKESPSLEPPFEAEFEDNFDFKPEKGTPEEPELPLEEKPKLTEKELQILRLELENAEYLQLKSLLQAKINSEQFEIVKLRSHVALKNKQEGNSQNTKENRENTPEEPELKQRLMKEITMLEQKRLTLINQIFQERVACVQLKIELAMKEILSKS